MSFAGSGTWALKRVLVVITCCVWSACSGGNVVVSGPEAEQANATAAGSVTATSSAPETFPPTTPIPTTTTAPPTTIDPIDVQLSAMSVEDKVGQLLMPLVAGLSAEVVTPAEADANQRLAGFNTPAEIVSEYSLGGVIYLGHNISNAAQVTLFGEGLQQAAATAEIPGLFVAVDQEGGRVQRVSDGVTQLPSARAFAGDTDAIYQASLQLGHELLLQGFNVVFAPVADLSDGSEGVIRDRSYSADPDIAGNAVAAAVSGFADAGIASTVKHWPGHGATVVDSHASLPTVDVDYELWVARERVPFVAAFDADVDMVMVGHLALPGLDPAGQPATVSSLMIERLLRDEAGFDGVVVTDALDMGAVASIERGELAVQSVVAGVDILLAPPDLTAVRQALLDAVAQGRISSERLDESVRRILRLKTKLGLIDP